MPLLRRGRVWYALCLFCMLVPLFVHPATSTPVLAAPFDPAASAKQWTQATPTALLIANTADGITLTSADTALRQFLETTMGWSVTLKDDDLVQASDAAAVNIVVISASIDSYKLENDFTYVTTPIVVSEYALYDQLGMTNGVSGTDYGINSGTPTTTITILDPTHPLAGGKSGTVTIQSQSLRLPYGRPVNQGVKVANLPASASRTVLFGYDTGATMTIPSNKDGALVGSTPLAAPARRVGLFLDADTPLYLTSDGWDLVRTALLWAIGQTPPSGTPTPTTVAATATPAPATATSVPPTMVPATATATTVPATPAPATATALPATATSMPPTVTPPSGAGKTLLFVVGSLPVGSGDAAVLQRLTAAQYTVQVINQTNLTLEATAGMHGVLISSTVSASTIGTLLTTHPVPLLTWEYALYDDLRMTGTSSGTHFGTSTGSTLNLAAPTHPIAAGLSGIVSVSSGSISMAFGQPLAQATLVAALPNAPASAGIFTYAQGAALTTGNAPARRAGFFFDNTSPTSATTTGWALFDRSVAWLIDGFTPIQPATATPTATAVPSATPTASPTVAPSATPVVPPTATPVPTATPLIIPPDPAAVAPALSAFSASDLFADTAFLYTGAAPIQTGVAAGTIEAQRVAVIRGRVQDRNRQPIAGVQITIKDHPEFGMTHTRADGMFDLVVNGGSRLVVEYQHPAFLRVQRAVATPWRDSVWTPEVVLTPLSPIVTTIQLGGAAQAAEGTVSTDDRGTRQARLFFPAGITATLRLPSGATQSLNTIAVRASEYTVGDTGRAAMPGELPSTSGYTYAAEFSADEALAVDGSVEFSQAVANYTENFLGFPVGMTVPTGWYDAQRAVWVPSPNGRIIAILTSSPLTLDLTGDGVADDPVALGLSADEQAFLSTTYAPGTSLWRVPMTHFTPWDHNWPYGPPADAVGPNGEPLRNDPPINRPCEQPGSVITCETQSLGEQFDLAGTPFKLVYRSDAAAAHHQEVSIPLSGPTIPTSLQAIEVTVQVGGQQWTQAFSPTADLATIFTWDGKDAYGRLLQGTQPATVKIRFIYPGQYRTPAQFGSAFGQFGTDAIALTGDRAALTVTAERTMQTTLGRLHTTQNALGGWSLDSHHQYDLQQRTLYRGDGSQQQAEARVAFQRDGVGAYPLVWKVAPTAAGGRYEIGDGGTGRTDLWEWLPDGTRIQRSMGIQPRDGQLLATTGFNIIRDIHTSPTGDLYLTDEGSTWTGTPPAIYRIRADQRLERVVGGTTKALTTTADGALARTMPIGMPMAIDVDPDGTLWFVDNYFLGTLQPDGAILMRMVSTLRAVRADGRVITPIDPARLRCGFSTLQQEQITAITHDATGNHYLTIRGRYQVERHPTGTGCILKVDAAGTVTRIAGMDTNGQKVSTYTEGGLAADAPLVDVADLHVHPDGRLIVQETGAIREILPTGEIRTILGHPDFTTDTQIGQIYGSMVVPDGQISFSTRAIQRGTLLPPYPGAGQARLEVPSLDGSEVYVFTPNGQHLQTRDTMTGIIRYSFLYDSAGRLTGVRNQHGGTTTIERAADGTPTAVVSPDGVTTTLTVGADGLITQINDPTQSVWQLQYQDGLLTRLIDPRNPTWVHQYTYTADGRLSHDTGATGGWTALAQTQVNATTSIITSTTATGITTRHTLSTAADGTTTRIVATVGGTTTTTQIDAAGNQVLIDDRGMRRTTTMAPDPRWGMAAPYPAAITVTNPAGEVVATTTMQRSVTLSDAGDPWSVTTWREVLTQQGLTTTTIYTPATRTKQVTLPSGVVRITTYTAAGQPILETATDLAPKSWTYYPDGKLASDTIGGGATATTTSYAYTPKGFVAAITNAVGETTTYTHDAAGRIATLTHPTGHTRQYWYDAVGNRIQERDERGMLTTWVYNADNQPVAEVRDVNGRAILTTATYDLHGRMVRQSTAQGANRPPAVTTYGYAALNPVASVPISVTNALGDTTTYTYDAVGDLVGVTDALQQTTVLTYTPEGWLAAVQSPSGQIIRRSYRTDGQVLSETDARGSTTTYTYTPLRQPETVTVNTTAVAGYPAVAARTTTSYDGWGRVVRVQDPRQQVTTFHYTDRDQLAWTELPTGEQSRYTYDALGRPITTVTGAHDAPTAVTTTMTYDAAGRVLTTVVDPTGLALTTRYRYTEPGASNSWDLHAVVDPNGHTTRYQTNALGWVTATTNALTETWTMTYDQQGNQTGITDPRGNTLAWEYDAVGHRIMEHEAGRTQRWQYRADGRLSAQIDMANRTTSYAYSRDGFLTGIDYPTGTADVSYSHDPNGNVTSMQDGLGTTTYRYDGLNRLRERTRDGRTVGYTYDAASFRTGTDYWGTGSVTATPDAAGRVASLQAWGGATTTYAYGARGQLATATSSTGLGVTPTYDTAGRPLATHYTHNGTAMASFGSTLDAVGNRTTLTDANGTTTLTYDATDRMVQAAGPQATTAYTHDAVGNRTSVATTGQTLFSMQYDAANRLTTSGYSHDPNGNLTTTPDATYTYDAANRVTSSTTSAGTTTYGYDGWGNLVRVTTNGVVQDLVLDEAAGLPQVLGTVSANGTTRVARDGAGLLHQTTNAQATTLLTDLVGSVRQGITPSGTTLFSQAFTVDGVPRSHSGSATSAFGFTGEWTNPLDGLVYLRARHYLPTLGRFIQRDTDTGSGLAPASLHRYAYVDNNPATWTDPTGHRKGVQPDGTWIPCMVYSDDPDEQCLWSDYTGFFGTDSGDDFKTMVKQIGKRIEHLPGDMLNGAVSFIQDPIGTIMAMPGSIGTMIDNCQQGMFCYNYEALGDCVWDVGNTAVGGGFGGAGLVDDIARFRGGAGYADDLRYFADDLADGMCSFTPDTPVATPNGPQPIARLREGDTVLGYDETTQTTGAYSITALLIHDDPVVLDLTLDGETITTTPEHPFYVQGMGWVPAGELQLGAAIRTARGTWGYVQTSVARNAPQTMYNLTVAEAHTFFVGDDQWLVHNASKCPIKARIHEIERLYGADNVHGLRRHGAGTQLRQQARRAKSGLTPDHTQLGYRPNSARFFDNKYLLEAYEEALANYVPGGNNGRKYVKIFDHDIGEGYYTGGTERATTNRVVVSFDEQGRIISIYPELP